MPFASVLASFTAWLFLFRSDLHNSKSLAEESECTISSQWQPAVMPTITGKEATQLILRWFHFIAGILWVGLLYFFNLVNVPFMKQVDASMKPKIFQNLTLPALNWFRWSSLVTVFIGFWYWGQFLCRS